MTDAVSRADEATVVADSAVKVNCRLGEALGDGGGRRLGQGEFAEADPGGCG